MKILCTCVVEFLYTWSDQTMPVVICTTTHPLQICSTAIFKPGACLIREGGHWSVYVYVCVSTLRELIIIYLNCSMYDWLNKFYSLMCAYNDSNNHAESMLLVGIVLV